MSRTKDSTTASMIFFWFLYFQNAEGLSLPCFLLWTQSHPFLFYNLSKRAFDTKSKWNLDSFHNVHIPWITRPLRRLLRFLQRPFVYRRLAEPDMDVFPNRSSDCTLVFVKDVPSLDWWFLEILTQGFMMVSRQDWLPVNPLPFLQFQFI